MTRNKRPEPTVSDILEQLRIERALIEGLTDASKQRVSALRGLEETERLQRIRDEREFAKQCAEMLRQLKIMVALIEARANPITPENRAEIAKYLRAMVALKLIEIGASDADPASVVLAVDFPWFIPKEVDLNPLFGGPGMRGSK